MHHDNALELQELVLLQAAQHVGQNAAHVRAFAQARGLYIMKYDAVLGTWYLSDGEPYTTAAIIAANVADWDDAI